MLLSYDELSEPATIEMTPLIDMVFLLLIFFLVATTFHREEREIQIALPAAMAAEPITTVLRDLIVNVGESGDIIVGGQTVTPEAFGDMVAGAVKRNAEQKVTVRGDRRTAYDNVARVLDLCKSAGVREPFLDTVPAGS